MFPFMSELNETEQTRADIQNWNISGYFHVKFSESNMVCEKAIVIKTGS